MSAILFQFFHPYPERSRANRALLDTVLGMVNVQVNDVYARYPNFHVDADREQALMVAADLIVFQHPFYWYSGPALLKEWIDVTLANGFAYGSRGMALQGKSWLHSVTTGMPSDTYGPGGFNAHTMAEFLRPFEFTARFCRMNWLEPLIFHDAHAASDEFLRRHCEQLRRRLQGWTDGGAGPPPAAE